MYQDICAAYILQANAIFFLFEKMMKRGRIFLILTKSDKEFIGLGFEGVDVLGLLGFA